LEKGKTISVETMNLVLHSDLIIENGVLAQELVIEGNWRYRQELMTEYAKKGDLYLTQDLYLRRIVREPRRKTLRDLFPRVGTSGEPAKPMINLNDLFIDGWGTNEDANEELRVLLNGQNILEYPKPVQLISKLICSVRDENSVICDFFSGSGTTAHAVLDLNKQDGGNRKFILVQLPEPTEREDYPTIADICKERVRRVIKKLNEENSGKLPLEGGQTQDRGFRVYKLAESNFKPWNADVPPDAKALEQQLEMHVEHIRESRTADDLLYEILLKSSYPLTSPLEKLTLAGKTVYSIAGGLFFICLERELTMELIREMAARKPERVVFLDEGFAGNDQLKANAVQIFKTKGVTSFKTV
jgi:adenine-specific DNA-methyltransferase